MSRIVVKVGTSTLTGGTPRLHRPHILELVKQLSALHQKGHEVILVSSGAQAAGRERLNFPDYNKSVPFKQMLAAVGQGRLMHLYSQLFDLYDLTVAQILLTRDDLSQRGRYLNVRDTFAMLLEERIIPIINENDTVATNEIRVGDNDNLSAMVASVLEADFLVILTDQQGLFTADPRKNPSALLIQTVERIDAQIFAIAGGVGSKLGTGGMTTKIEAAQLATRSGVTTIIASGSEHDVLTRLFIQNEPIGTRFLPTSTHLEGRKRWMLTDRPQGAIIIDDGASHALTGRGASLLPVGMVRVDGHFERGEVVRVCNLAGVELARGLANYDSADMQKLCRLKSSQIADILGYTYGDYVVHRNDMVMLG